MVRKGNHGSSKILVKWKGLDRSESLWEDYSMMASKFFEFNFMAEV